MSSPREIPVSSVSSTKPTPAAPPVDRRAEVFARIREALGRPTDAHVKHGTLQNSTGQTALYGQDASAAAHRVMQASPDDEAARLAQFAAFSEKLRVRLEVVADAAAASACLASLAAEEQWQRVGAHQHPLVAEPVARLGGEVVWTDEPGGYDPQALERCDAGVSGCDYLIAQTGSIVVTPVSAGGRTLSVLPPHHIVIAQQSQLLGTMAEAFDRLRLRYGADWPTMISFITGPSRTGDIERILVLGAHGPRKLTVILQRDQRPSLAV